MAGGVKKDREVRMEIQPPNRSVSISIDQAVRQMQRGGKSAGEEGKARTGDEMEMGPKFRELGKCTDISINEIARQLRRDWISVVGEDEGRTTAKMHAMEYFLEEAVSRCFEATVFGVREGGGHQVRVWSGDEPGELQF